MLEDTIIHNFFSQFLKAGWVFVFWDFLGVVPPPPPVPSPVVISSTAFISSLVYRAGSKLHMSVYSSFIIALTFPLSAQKQGLYCRHQIQQ